MVDTKFPPKLSESPLNVGLPTSRLSSDIRHKIGGLHVSGYATTPRP